MTADALPDDVILEILERVSDAPALLRCAATCRRWRALVADPSFLRRRWPDPAYSLLGTFAAPPKKFSLSFLPGPRSALADGPRLLSSFVPGAAGLRADCVWPLASRGGLVLLSLFNHIRIPGRGVPRAAVCSLLAGTCHVLPQFEWYKYNRVGQAVLTGADCSPSLFKVLMIVARETHYELHTMVAGHGQPSWNASIKCRSRAALGHPMHSEAVVCQGAAHWLFFASSTFLVVRVDAGTGRVSETKLTSPGASELTVQRDRTRLAATADGKLLSLCLYDPGLQLVEIWTQPAAGRGGDWPRTGVIDLKPILHLEQPRYISLRGRCGKLIIICLLARQRHGYLANLETGTMQELDDMDIDWTDLMKYHVYMEIDWTAFFMARLASMNNDQP